MGCMRLLRISSLGTVQLFYGGSAGPSPDSDAGLWRRSSLDYRRKGGGGARDAEVGCGVEINCMHIQRLL